MQLLENTPERVALLGASRGLGASFFQELLQCSLQGEILLFARKEPLLRQLAKVVKENPSPKLKISVSVADFSQTQEQERVLEQLSKFRPHRIFYFAGGGPFGPFEQRSWRDHQWALEVSFLFPARLLHSWMSGRILPTEGPICQFVAVGSHVAEAQPDPLAASYAAAKHGLRGLIRSIQEENSHLDLRLFSPTYLDTDMLPKNAAPRLNNIPIFSPYAAAQSLLHWAYFEMKPRHKIFNP